MSAGDLELVELGVLASEFMEHVANDFGGQGATIGACAIVAEVDFVDEAGDRATSITFMSTDPRRWIQRALFTEAADAVRHSQTFRRNEDDE